MPCNVAVVFGSTGTVGSCIAKEFLKCEGIQLVLPIRNPRKLDRSFTDDQRVFVVEVPELCSAAGMQTALSRTLDRFGEDCIKTVVACFGGRGASGPVFKCDDERAFDYIVERNKPHFFAWTTFGRKLIEANRPGTSYIVMTGYQGLQGSIGITSLGAAMQIGISRIAIHETKGTNVQARAIDLAFVLKPDEQYEQDVRSGSAQKHVRGSSFFSRLVPLVALADELPEEVQSGDRVIRAELDSFDDLLSRFSNVALRV